jgi:telomerase reverse transcriptase
VANISWLAPQNFQNPSGSGNTKLALSDFQKRAELLHEFINYLFESILIPLIRTNFYVTESQTHRNRLFFFRHDVWRSLTEQPMADLKVNMFEQLSPDKAHIMLGKRSLGLGALRLLPKSAGLRPILNLKKRFMMKSQWGNNKTYLGASVNSNLAPIYNMLSYERERCPEKLGSSLMSVGDMHSRLKEFKNHINKHALVSAGPKAGRLPQLFFVKLDIQACFDTIPQKELLCLVEQLVSEEAYHVTRYVAMHPAMHGRATRRFLGRAAPPYKQQYFPDLAAGGTTGAANTVYVDTIKQKEHDADELLCLLEEHVRNNLVKIGKNYFRQRNGIPQGSVLSSLLCNFFYAQLEQQVLNFLQPADSLLLRLVDDFLLITTDVDQATQFLQVMHRGQPAYGVSVHPAKSMVNFTAAVDGIYIPRLEGTPLFPYCGCLIDTHTLEIHKDQDRMLERGASAAATLSNTLTVETSRLPGRSFHRRMLALMRPQLHSMYLDADHNTRNVVLANLYTGFITAAMKMYRYMKSLRGRAHPQYPIIIQTINDLVQQTASLIQTRRASRSAPLACFVQLSHLQYLASAAFRFVLRRKQTRYAPVLHWLDSLWRASRPVTNAEAMRLLRVVRKGNALFEAWRF